MLIANILFAAIVARMSRRKFIPLAYAFFYFQSRAFLCPGAGPVRRSNGSGLDGALYVWVGVCNQYPNTAIFWAFATDLFTVERGKRLYGSHRRHPDRSAGFWGAIHYRAPYVRDLGPVESAGDFLYPVRDRRAR